MLSNLTNNLETNMRYIHISARLTTIMMPNGTMQTVVARPGSTFNAGRNAEKRAARGDVKRVRAEIVKHYASTPGFDRAPKRDNVSRPRVDMLSDRRLRQRGGESDPRAVSHRQAA
jgi:hypothetical protein